MFTNTCEPQNRRLHPVNIYVHCAPTTHTAQILNLNLKSGYAPGSHISRLGMRLGIASFPGLPSLQFLIACSMQKHTAGDQKLEARKPGNDHSNK